MNSSNVYQPSAYPPSKMALLFLDYQNILINMIPSPGKEELVNTVETLLAAARKNNIAMVHYTTQDPAATNKVTEPWASQYKPILSADPQLGLNSTGSLQTTAAPIARLCSREPQAPGLVSYLRDKLGVAHLILGGIATSGAILGTMSHGTDINFVVSVVADACWDPNDQVHRDLIEMVIPSLAWVPSVEEAVGYMIV